MSLSTPRSPSKMQYIIRTKPKIATPSVESSRVCWLRLTVVCGVVGAGMFALVDALRCVSLGHSRVLSKIWNLHPRRRDGRNWHFCQVLEVPQLDVSVSKVVASRWSYGAKGEFRGGEKVPVGPPLEGTRLRRSSQKCLIRPTTKLFRKYKRLPKDRAATNGRVHSARGNGKSPAT